MSFNTDHSSGDVPSEKPGKPRDLVITSIAAETVSLKWAAPQDPGASEITGYVLQSLDCEQLKDQKELSADVTEHSVTRLTGVQSAVYRIAAVNEHGQGPYAYCEWKFYVKNLFRKWYQVVFDGVCGFREASLFHL